MPGTIFQHPAPWDDMINIAFWRYKFAQRGPDFAQSIIASQDKRAFGVERSPRCTPTSRQVIRCAIPVPTSHGQFHPAPATPARSSNRCMLTGLRTHRCHSRGPHTYATPSGVLTSVHCAEHHGLIRCDRLLERKWAQVHHDNRSAEDTCQTNREESRESRDGKCPPDP